MRIFIDTEFLEDGVTIMPISLALVAEDGRELYIEFQFDERRVLEFPDPFVKDHVLPHLHWNPNERITFSEARARVGEFLYGARSSPPKPEFWGYFADYDWVLLCRLWGRMVDLPSWMPKFCMDTQQWWVQLGRPAGVKPEQPDNEHHALVDARWTRDFWHRLAGVALHRDLAQQLPSNWNSPTED